MPNKFKIAVFGGGCFWCTEAVFKMLKGVTSVEPGYAGGSPSINSKDNPSTGSGYKKPSYEDICTGKTGHAEVIKIEYDPEKIYFRDLLTVFFGSHDPTTPNRQGADIGTQYRSIILYSDQEQKKEAENFIKELNASSEAGAPVVTEVKPLTQFFEAEDYHKNYYERNKEKSYCQVVINPKLEKIQKEFAKLLDSGSRPE